MAKSSSILCFFFALLFLASFEDETKMTATGANDICEDAWSCDFGLARCQEDCQKKHNGVGNCVISVVPMPQICECRYSC
ncbi:Putative defensin-like protein 186 [Linum grandiflorum]